jgi:hypothetical protein
MSGLRGLVSRRLGSGSGGRLARSTGGLCRPVGDTVEPLVAERRPVDDTVEPLAAERRPVGDSVGPYPDGTSRPVGDTVAPLVAERRPVGDSVERFQAGMSRGLDDWLPQAPDGRRSLAQGDCFPAPLDGQLRLPGDDRLQRLRDERRRPFARSPGDEIRQSARPFRDARTRRDCRRRSGPD